MADTQQRWLDCVGSAGEIKERHSQSVAITIRKQVCGLQQLKDTIFHIQVWPPHSPQEVCESCIAVIADSFGIRARQGIFHSSKLIKTFDILSREDI